MRRRPKILAGLLALGGCLTLDPLLFSPKTVESYGWDDNPCDPQLDGGLSRGCHPSRIPAAARTEGFVDAQGLPVHYVFAAHEDPIATIFYSHGNALHLGRYWDRVELMWSLGFNVMIYDYPGYGRSQGGTQRILGVCRGAGRGGRPAADAWR